MSQHLDLALSPVTALTRRLSLPPPCSLLKTSYWRHMTEQQIIPEICTIREVFNRGLLYQLWLAFPESTLIFNYVSSSFFCVVNLLRRTASSEVFMWCLIRSTARKLAGTTVLSRCNEAWRITGMHILLCRFCSVCSGVECHVINTLWNEKHLLSTSLWDLKIPRHALP